jgi:methylase of polypeptide subunit release factors
MASPPHSETYGLDAYSVSAYVPEHLVEEMYDGRTLGRLLARKLGRKLSRGRLAPRRSSEGIVAFYDGIAVFDRPDQHRGGMAFGRDFPRVLNELGVGRRGRLFEFCAGPGYIGYSLLAAGWCETLVLSDVEPGAIASARHTAAYNGLEDRVTAYVSDALDQIPDAERWDLVVANPPHFLPDPSRPEDIQVFDPDWSLHRRFYSSVERHMRPGGLAIVAENRAGSDPNLFADMIRDGGGRPVTVHPGTDVRGRRNGLYYQVSEWGAGRRGRGRFSPRATRTSSSRG